MKTKKNTKLFMLAILIAINSNIFAQVLISNTTGTPNASSMLEIRAANAGLLIPNIALTGTSDATTIASGNVTSLLIYNTATVSDVTPGYYYWNGTAWTTFGGISGSGATNHITYWSDANTIAHDQNELIWDATNHRMGIGVANPTAKVDVLYTSTTTGDQAAARIELTRSSSNNNDNIGLNLISQNTGLSSNAGEVIALKSYAKAGTSATNSSGNSYGIYNESYSYMNNAYGLYSITETVGDEEDDAIETYGAYLVTKNNSISSKTNRRQLWGIYNEIETPGMENTYGMHTKIKRQQVGSWDYTSKNIYGSYIDIDGGSNTTNAYGIYSTVTGATNNYAAYFGGGNVGIGTLTPQATLDVNGEIAYRGVRILTGAATDPYLNVRIVQNISTTMQDGLWINYNSTGAASANAIRFFTPGLTERMKILGSGRVGIGTSTPNEMLEVAGNVRATSFIATTVAAGAYKYNTTTNMNVPDYVFENYYLGCSNANPIYQMSNLQDVEEFIKTNHHLPRVPSREEILNDGVVNIQGLQMITLEKVEELFIYTIEQQAQIQKQQAQINMLIKQNQELVERINIVENK